MPFNSSFYDTVKLSTDKASRNFIQTPINSVFLKTKNMHSLEAPKLPCDLTPMNVDYSTNMFVRLSKSPKIDSSKFGEAVVNKLSSKTSDSVNPWLSTTDTSVNLPSTNNLYRSHKAPMFDDSSRFYKRKQNYNNAVTIRPVYVSDDSLKSIKNGDLNLLNSSFESKGTDMLHKPAQQNYFMVMKQKRYKRRKSIADTSYQLSSKATDYYNLNPNNKTVKGKILLTRNNQLERSSNDLTKNYNFFRKNKKRADDTNINVSRRMIRTKRTLVLPAHVNITAITNSYDVIHSWFIPGLGLKMDCIPGRSTHHTFYVDNVGFYYGQCAEVCGRYHHHMPIRICALPFDHFLLWWHHFGLPKYLGTSTNKSSDIKYGLRKYVW